MTNQEREREREGHTKETTNGVRIHDQRVLREAREDRPGDVREGVQSERTSDGETGAGEEDAIGGELFFSSRAVRCFLCSPGKRPPMHTLVFLVVPAARESVLDRTAGARKRGERSDAHRVLLALALARSFDASLVLLHVSNAPDDVCDFFGRGEL